MALIPNWRDAWRLWSIQFMTAALAAEVAWKTLPKVALDVIPDPVEGWAAIVFAVLGIVARVIDQKLAKGKAA